MTIFILIVNVAQLFVLFLILRHIKFIADDSARREDIRTGLDSLKKMLKDS